MIRTICAIAVGLAATVAMAQQNPILVRQEAMKKMNDDAKALSAMVKGDASYDAAKVNAVLSSWDETVKQKLPTLFPDDSKTGDKTRAKPEIWEKKADFDAKIADFAKAVAEAKAQAGSADSFKAAYPNLTKACDSCHQSYRGPRPS
jgi:cytochrome c556